MTLTDADLARLERAGHAGFWDEDREGTRRLCNREGHCVFLRDGLCVAYQDRPEGCRLYPLVLYIDGGEVDTDDFCPHHLEFRFTSADRARLRGSVAREEGDARRRTRERPSRRA
jgi:uncharacterized protein